MQNRGNLKQQLGAVFMPLAEDVIGAEDGDADPGFDESVLARQPQPFLQPQPFSELRRPPFEVYNPFPWPPRWQFCRTTLDEGCYTLSFNPVGASLFATRYRGTLRVEKVGFGYRISADLYRYRLIDDLVIARREPLIARRTFGPFDEASDSNDIPIYKRKDYESYLRGKSAQLFSIVPAGTKCSFTLTFDEFEYNHPATGFDGSFDPTPDRTVRFVLSKEGPKLYKGTAFEGNTNLGTVSIRHVSSFYRRAALVIHTLDGAVPPPTVGTTYFDDIFANAGWKLSVSDGGEVSMPSTISGQSKTQCWSTSNLHRLMASVPGYDPDDLDTVWRSHLVAVQAKLGCSRGVMFDSSGDLNNIAREGSATFSDDGYNKSHSSNFGTAEDDMQRDHPRAFLRSATHEVGHAFNQIHQELETSADNSIMTTTPSVADELAANSQTFPNDINLTFNDTNRTHLRHLPDPAVRPGAMGFFGSAVNAPEPADVHFLDEVELTVKLDSDRVRLGEPVKVSWVLKNTTDEPILVPSSIDHRALISRVSVTDPEGHVTFLRPVDQFSCARVQLVELAPKKTLKDETTLFYGRDGFTMERPGKHHVTVVVLWEVAGAPVAVSATAELFVSYPISDNDNEVAKLLLDPAVGRAVATGHTEPYEGAEQRIKDAGRAAKTHPACEALRKMGLTK